MIRPQLLPFIPLALVACATSGAPAEHPATTELARRRHLALICYATAPAIATEEERTRLCSRELFRYLAYREGIEIAAEYGIEALQNELPSASVAERALARCLERHPPSFEELKMQEGPCKLELVAYDEYSAGAQKVYATLLNARLDAAAHPSFGQIVEGLLRNRLQRSGSGQAGRNVQRPGFGAPVYERNECIGPAVAGECKGHVVPYKAYRPKCYGEWLNGRCTGPLF